MDRRDFLTLTAIAAIVWCAAVATSTPEPEVEIREVVRQVQPAESFSLRAEPSWSTIVFLADQSSPYSRKWMATDGAACRSKGWKITTVDLVGSDEVRYYVSVSGKWKIHSGQMSLASLSALAEAKR